jgi:hypothetical protein
VCVCACAGGSGGAWVVRVRVWAGGGVCSQKIERSVKRSKDLQSDCTSFCSVEKRSKDL